MKFGSWNVNFCVLNIILDISFLEWRLWWLLKIFGWIPCYLILPVEWVRSGSGHHNWLMVLNINAIFIESYIKLICSATFICSRWSFKWMRSTRNWQYGFFLFLIFEWKKRNLLFFQHHVKSSQNICTYTTSLVTHNAECADISSSNMK